MNKSIKTFPSKTIFFPSVHNSPYRIVFYQNGYKYFYEIVNIFTNYKSLLTFFTMKYFIYPFSLTIIMAYFYIYSPWSASWIISCTSSSFKYFEWNLFHNKYFAFHVFWINNFKAPFKYSLSIGVLCDLWNALIIS